MIYFIEREYMDRFEKCVEYNGLAWFPKESYRNKEATDFNSIEDAEAVAIASALTWPGFRFRVMEADDNDDEGAVPKLKKEFFEPMEVSDDRQDNGGRGDAGRDKASGRSKANHTNGQGGVDHTARKPKRPAGKRPEKDQAGGSKPDKRERLDRPERDSIP
jgi:hypothetical protein